MTEPTPIILSSPDAGNRGAGEMLRLAREAQNMTIEGLAATIKVTPAKLDALEQGQFDKLPDANFTRALAMTVCRALKLDPTAVLAALPAARPTALAEGKPPLNQPFKDVRGGSPLFDRQWDWSGLLTFKWLAPIVLLAGAVVIYVLPDSVDVPAWVQQVLQTSPRAVQATAVEQAASAALAQSTEASAPEVVADVPSDAAASASTALPVVAASGAQAPLVLDVVEGAASVAVAADPRLATVAHPSASMPMIGAGAGPLVLTVTAASWVDVRDAKGVKLLSQQVTPGQTLSLNGTPPLKVLIGNAAGVSLSYKGQPVDMALQTRNNVARVELK
ncbi:MAG: helix-turn-helix domain-containing protein [Aquabacterium sp.]|uniref:helix-turn-helix domain-containing protein n=1 Tax=Aquabacterium sp. TaxID=1872578 RepID=UPI0025C1CCF6|nr:RodZ domain-containing protein [Aquabacterium sp.]MBI5925692.1 helix-turn-helix domain-containing protein [Aquabacterium sp.]